MFAISKKVAMAAVEHLEMVSPILHGDVVRLEGELINIGRSSLTLQVTGYRHDIATRKFVHAVDAVMTAVALDENNRPYRGLPELVDPNNGNRIERLREVVQHRKNLSMRRKKLEESVDQLSTISLDMLAEYPRSGEEVAVQDTVVALSTSFLPRHLNRNGTVFGGEILAWMVTDKTALYCARAFTANSNMVTVSASQIGFKLPITTDDIVTIKASVCATREHYVEVAIEVFLKKFGAQECQKSHTGYFSIANLNESDQIECVTQVLRVNEDDQNSLRALLKAQNRRQLRDEEHELLHFQPLGLSPISGSHL
ncbi:putative acyl-CoA thioester hydrolase [Phytophthora citrophthora]|uniref:Acyl-CoA thioester hydrolase n=1 Tax=Phytophthora citrophthora TaxID=4793 RepID=A0AAD9G2Q5_9STRA|nr:putative acyl-CoA thioester hydrolase [Phytophthora citrophthora]